MQAFRTHLRGRISVLVASLLAVAGLQAFTASSAQALGTGVVIREVYGAGGNRSGSTPTSSSCTTTAGPQNLNGLSVQYRSAGGGVGGISAPT